MKSQNQGLASLKIKRRLIDNSKNKKNKLLRKKQSSLSNQPKVRFYTL